MSSSKGWRERQRAKLGEVEFKRLEAERMRKSRERNGRKYDRARNRATSELIRLHRAEFTALVDRYLKDGDS